MSVASLITVIPSIETSTIVPLCQRIKKVYSDPDELRKKVDAFLLAYDRQEAESRRNSKIAEVDEDGFTLVKPTFSSTVATTDAVPESKKRKSKGEDVNDFYRFQLKERKMAEWGAEKLQAAQDTIKFNEMKSNNKFQL